MRQDARDAEGSAGEVVMGHALAERVANWLADWWDGRRELPGGKGTTPHGEIWRQVEP